MDFSAVPAGTAAPAALALRGADHDVEFAVASRFNAILGDALNATNALGVANTKAVAYSDLAGAITCFLFTSDAAVLSSVLWQNVISPAKLQAAFTYLTQNFSVAPLSLIHI